MGEPFGALLRPPDDLDRETALGLLDELVAPADRPALIFDLACALVVAHPATVPACGRPVAGAVGGAVGSCGRRAGWRVAPFGAAP